jgi:hypothetical protein
MKNIFLIFTMLCATLSFAQSLDGRRNTTLPEKTTIDTNDIMIVGDYPTGKWYRAKYTNVLKQYYQSTYTPTAAAVTNVATVTPTVANYTRIGNNVSVWGEVSINTSAQVASECTLTLPIASNIAATYDLSGFAANNDTSFVRILGNISGDKASLKWKSLDTTNKSFSYSYQYHIN